MAIHKKIANGVPYILNEKDKLVIGDGMQFYLFLRSLL